jgi:enterochelin esterase-like enzyme
MRQMDKNGIFLFLGHFPGRAVFILLLLLFAALAACSPTNPPQAASQPLQPSGVTETPAFSPSPTVTAAATIPPTLAVTPTPAGCQQTNGQIVKGIIDTRLLDKPMTYNVYLPPCYSFETNRRYPVLYLLHGQNFTEEQWLRIGAARTADSLIAAGQVPPFIIVMPFDHSFKQPSEYRFEDVFIELLLPQIDMAYRTNPNRENRAIGGLSRGGAWAIHLGTRHPELFGAIGAHSPAVFYSDTSTLRLRLRDLPPDQTPEIFIDAGDHDVELEKIENFVALLNEMQIPHEWHAYLGFHEEKYWSAHVEEYLRWYASHWNQ